MSEINDQFNLDELLAKLRNDSEKKSGLRLKKLLMNSPKAVGSSITALPILVDGNLYYKLDSVREWNTTSNFYREGDSPAWIKLLDRTAYGELTAEESELWKNTRDALEELIEIHGDFYTARFRRYTLMPVYIIKFVDENGVEDPDMIGTALLIFPTHNPIKALNSAITLMTNTVGSNSWMPLVLSPNLKGRKGALTIKFNRSTTSKGYDTTINVVMNSEYVKIVDPTKDYSEDIELDPIREFLGWQVGDKLFDNDIITELYNNATAEIERLREQSTETAPADKKKEKVQDAVEDEVDPALEDNPEEVETKSKKTKEESKEEPGVETAPTEEKDSKLPF